MIPNIIADVEKILLQEAKVLPHKSNWASVLSDKCLRRLVYYRTNWDAQLPPDARLQGIFNTGKKLERVVRNIINEIGREAKPQWELIDTGVKLNDVFLSEHDIGGEPDTFLKIWGSNGEKPKIVGPVELKGFDSNLFKQVHTIEDFKKYAWMLKYLGQLQIYEIGSNFEIGWFLIFNKSNLWEYRIIEYPLDYAFVEKLVKASDEVNRHVKAKTLPDKINDPDECPKCPFASICNPEYSTGGNLQISDDVELEGILNRLKELEPTKEEIDDLEKVRDNILIKGQDIAIGKWVILWKKVVKNMKATEAKAIEYWQKKIVYKA